jgi:hypothetical protein
MQSRTDRRIDDEIFGLDSGLFTNLPPLGRLTLPASRPNSVDDDVLNLHTTLFDTLPPVRLDTLAPVAPAEAAPGQVAPAEAAPPHVDRPAHWTRTVVEVMAAATTVGVLLGAGLFALTRTPPAPRPEPAALVAPQGVAAAPVAAAPAEVAAVAAPVARAPVAAPPAGRPSSARGSVTLPAAEARAPAEPALQPWEHATEPPGFAALPPSARLATLGAPPDLPPAAPPGADLALPAPAPEARALHEGAAATAIAVAARRAASCVPRDDTRTTMPVRVTFAPSGRVTTAVLRGGPLLGTEEGACVARALRSATVGAFEGPPVMVSTVIRLR